MWNGGDWGGKWEEASRSVQVTVAVSGPRRALDRWDLDTDEWGQKVEKARTLAVDYTCQSTSSHLHLMGPAVRATPRTYAYIAPNKRTFFDIGEKKHQELTQN